MTYPLVFKSRVYLSIWGSYDKTRTFQVSFLHCISKRSCFEEINQFELKIEKFFHVVNLL